MNNLKTYDHGDYIVKFDPTNGYFERHDMWITAGRSQGKYEQRPEWSPNGPELADIHITKYCPLNCSYCYRDSDPSKKQHMSVSDFSDVIDALLPWVCQVAIGGGSPQHHPEFIELLRIAHDKGVVPSWTTNGVDLTPEIIEASKKYCGAVAVSMHPQINPFPAIMKMLKGGVPTAIHVVLTHEAIDKWTEQLRMAREGKGILGGMLPLYSCIFLMHKPIGRGSWEQHPTFIQKMNFVAALRTYKGPIALGVDSCAAPSLISSSPIADLPVENLGPCDSGCFSVFVDEELLVSPCSFNKDDVFSLEDFSFQEIWKDKLMPYRNKVLDSCPSCDSRELCRGCQILPGINPCGKEERTC
jgi:radical SAM protein with 4Fe4S-binding SPASM domain